MSDRLSGASRHLGVHWTTPALDSVSFGLVLHRISHFVDILSTGSREREHLEGLGNVIREERDYLVHRLVKEQDDPNSSLERLLHRGFAAALHALRGPEEARHSATELIDTMLSLDVTLLDQLREEFSSALDPRYRSLLLQHAFNVSNDMGRDLCLEALEGQPQVHHWSSSNLRRLVFYRDLLRDGEMLDHVARPGQEQPAREIASWTHALCDIDKGRAVSEVFRGESPSSSFVREAFLLGFVRAFGDGSVRVEAMARVLEDPCAAGWVATYPWHAVTVPTRVKRSTVTHLFESARATAYDPGSAIHHDATIKLLSWLGSWKQHLPYTYLGRVEASHARMSDLERGSVGSERALYPAVLSMLLTSASHRGVGYGLLGKEMTDPSSPWIPRLTPLVLSAVFNDHRSFLGTLLALKHTEPAVHTVLRLVEDHAATGASTRAGLLLQRWSLLARFDDLAGIVGDARLSSDQRRLLRASFAEAGARVSLR
jgi:hypothetical protein